MGKVAEAVKLSKKKHAEDAKQISLFDYYHIEDIVIKVRKK